LGHGEPEQLFFQKQKAEATRNHSEYELEGQGDALRERIRVTPRP
jgi:hypothetical protein